jgi:hypothetical protein
MDSAICAKLVPWSGVEEESRAIREHVDPDDRDSFPICEGSDGELAVVRGNKTYDEVD